MNRRLCKVCESPLPVNRRKEQQFCSGRCRTRFWLAGNPDRRDAPQKLIAIRALLNLAEPSKLRAQILSILDETRS